MTQPCRQSKPAPRLCWGLWILVLALVRPAPAYYRDDQTVPRDFRIDDEYFVDEEPLLPSLDEREMIRSAPRLYWASVGSFTSTDLYNQHRLRMVYPVPGTPLRLRAEYETDRDFDGIYSRFYTGLAFAPGGPWAVEVFGQPLARKQYADVGAALDYAGDSARLRTEWVFPHFWYNDKNDEGGHHVRAPMALRLDGAVQLPRLPLELFARASVDFPSETRIDSDEYNFTYRSWKPTPGGSGRWTTPAAFGARPPSNTPAKPATDSNRTIPTTSRPAAMQPMPASSGATPPPPAQATAPASAGSGSTKPIRTPTTPCACPTTTTPPTCSTTPATSPSPAPGPCAPASMPPMSATAKTIPPNRTRIPAAAASRAKSPSLSNTADPPTACSPASPCKSTNPPSAAATSNSTSCSDRPLHTYCLIDSPPPPPYSSHVANNPAILDQQPTKWIELIRWMEWHEKERIMKNEGYASFVVIAVVAMVSAILFPAVNKATLNADMVQAVSNGANVYKAAFAAQMYGTFDEGGTAFPKNGQYRTSTEYFMALVESGVLSVSYDFFAARGIPPARSSNAEDFKGENNAWRVVLGIEDAPEGTPFMFTRNYDPGSLQTGDGPILLNDEPPFGKEGMVVVLKGGSAFALKGNQLRNSFFNPAGTPSSTNISIIGP
jgi:type II secretory pathway pseudopilin PulG